MLLRQQTHVTQFGHMTLYRIAELVVLIDNIETLPV
jgi:hypothetical protein